MPDETPVLDIRDLCVRFTSAAGETEVVRGFHLRLLAGQTAAIVGESGSGKSQAMLATLGLLARNGRATGSARLQGEEILNLDAKALDRVRGSRVTMIFQEPMSSLDPLFRIGAQIAAPLRVHAGLSRRAARARALALLEEVGIADAARRIDNYPHQLSGGQRQRVMIAMAIANNPAVLIADEPTTALDATTQIAILDLLAGLQRRLGMAMIFITHDLALARRFAGTVSIMQAGAVVESGKTADVFAAPATAYARMLLGAFPVAPALERAPPAPAILVARDLAVTYRQTLGLFRTHRLAALAGLDFEVPPGRTLGIVGPSGSGKSTLGRALLGLVPATGSVTYKQHNLLRLSRAALRPLRKSLQIVFQDPFGSLSPRLRVNAIVGEGLRVHEPTLSRARRDARVAEALGEVGLDPATRRRFPHEFSGGQRQRIAIARAMILRPEVVVLDEPTSALDRAIQGEIVALLRRLQSAHGLAYVFISHDLAIVRQLADTVLVLDHGRIVEQGSPAQLFAAPRHAVTRALIAAAMLPAATGKD